MLAAMARSDAAANVHHSHVPLGVHYDLSALHESAAASLLGASGSLAWEGDMGALRR